MARYLLDTNHLGGVPGDISTVRERIYQTRQAGHRFGTCMPVLCELETGIYHTSRRDHNRLVLAMLVRQVRVWPLELAVAPMYAEI
jgi:predicted nucleic acid-binding protein